MYMLKNKSFLFFNLARLSLQGYCACVTLGRRLALAANDGNYVIINNYRVSS